MTIEQVAGPVSLDEHVDVIREAVKAVRAGDRDEASRVAGARWGERRPEDRVTHRSGYRPRRWGTRAGEIELQIPKLRQGSHSQAF
jgi:putative transposase